LNLFHKSTELAYGVILTSDDRRLRDRDAFAYEAFADVYSSAWYPSNQGRLKYLSRVSEFQDHLATNITFVARAVMVFWYSAFEQYLEARARAVTGWSGDKWGPFTHSLSGPSLRSASPPVRVDTVLRADLCRHVRNLIVHGVSALPDSVSHPEVRRWMQARRPEVAKTWVGVSGDRAVSDAVKYVIGGAVGQRNKAIRERRRENLEYFYSLFLFTNLDALAIEIEEATIPVGAKPEGRVTRKLGDIRRADLIVQRGAA
jgi:hypothetical protein